MAQPITSHAKNGVGVFIHPLKKLVFNYCERSGSSTGMIQFLKTDFFKFAAQHPHVEIIVTPKPSKVPCVSGVYLNSTTKTLSFANMSPPEITKRLKLLTEGTGAKVGIPKGGVVSTNEAVRGIWSPFR
ncbi:mitochondrial ribosomal protein L43 [Paraphysoderma sedebokerense]|nr:mitochondrial ribosomal protein L43 [Paraphysoderma sedebokerense]KAI9144406.1 mitochondrial ribosomal protein L43 [Paraphysoderma sedebokerense]